MSFVTRVFAPIVISLQTFIPGRTVVSAPINVVSPIFTFPHKVVFGPTKDAFPILHSCSTIAPVFTTEKSSIEENIPT